ncbi:MULTISPECIES: hypothetical protein [Microbulbifer]|uniref:hypothetical protein n=1 Tax=Microbulbifer TaxID=48073 RepID=UPI001E3CBA21|nr:MULTISPECIES: hypothetical protein [Microbulbifer]UHQ53724.1 hypothetical protein LVE68_09370 [Microbulbifer sp. YPW16]
MKLDSCGVVDMIPAMNTRSRHKSNLWTALLLLMALLSAQPVLAEHIHFVDPSHELCDVCFHQMSAAAGSEYRAIMPAPVTHYLRQSAPVPGDSQPERQTARAPPASLSH